MIQESQNTVRFGRGRKWRNTMESDVERLERTTGGGGNGSNGTGGDTGDDSTVSPKVLAGGLAVLWIVTR